MKTNICFMLFILILIHYIKGGTLLPPVSRSIDPFRSNQSAVGNYTFFIQTLTPIYQSPLIKINFPSIYKQVLKDSKNCKVFVIQKYQNLQENFDCWINQRSVIINLSSKWKILLAGLIEVYLSNVVNPSNSFQYSSGFFEIFTLSGLNLIIDSNMNFGTLGYSNSITKKTNISIINDGTDIASYLTNYIITFSINVEYKLGTWFRLKLPININLDSKLECYIIETNDVLPCYYKNSYIFTQGIKKILNLNRSWKLKILNIKNPSLATSNIGNFLFESLYDGVNIVIDQWENFGGLSISPGEITDASVKGFPLVQNLIGDYTIRFKTANFIPKAGGIKIVFPNDYTRWDGFCRIIEGLLNINLSSNINCEIINTRELKITNFKDFNPNYITVLAKAYNPSSGGNTGLFKVYSYNDNSLTQLIDKNENVGRVTISSISKPIFTKVDFYKNLFNCTFEENCKLDFIFFPLPNNFLPQSNTPTTYGQFDIQIPIFWWMISNFNPECKIGSSPSAECWQREQIISIKTKNNKNFEYCEDAISISRITLPSIPGKFPFRILSYRNGGKWTSNTSLFTTPLEQDTFIMDIPFTSISVLQVFSSSLNNGDSDNLLHIKGNIQPFVFSNEGAINLTFTHVEDTYSNKAAWPSNIGFSGVTDNSITEVPCKVYINSKRAGYRALNKEDHLKVRCFMFTGNSSNNDDTIIQILGFNSNLILGDYFEIFLTEISFCTTENRNCKLTVSYTLTQNYKDPYILNKSEVNLGIVQSPHTTFPTTLTGSVTRSNNEICSPITLNISVNLSQNLEVGDYFIISRITSHWFEDFYRFDSYTINVQGMTITGYPVLNKRRGWEQIIFKITQTITAGNNKIFTLNNLYTSPFPNQAASIKVDFWSNKIKILSGWLPDSVNSVDGGILNNSSDYKDGSNNRNDYFVRTNKHPFWIQFRTCKEIPSNGEIIITFPNNNLISQFTNIQNDCIPWYGINKQMRNITQAYCQFDTTNERFIIKNFDIIPPRSLLSFNFYATLNNAFTDIRYDIKTYNIAGTSSSLVNFLTSNQIISEHSVPYIFPHTYEYLGFKTYNWELYQNHRGSIVLSFETFNPINYDINETEFLEFVFSKNIMNPTEKIECRYGLFTSTNLLPSVDCTLSNENTDYYKLTIKLHPLLNINNTDKYKLVLTTRNDNIDEGFQFTQSGNYIFSLYINSGGSRTRIGNRVFEVLGQKLDHFYIYSSNKILNDDTQLSIYSENLSNNIQFIDSNLNNTNYDVIYLYFETKNTGFASNLGTSYANQSKFPCRLTGIPILSVYDQAQCKIFYGFNDSPTLIQIYGFQNGNVNNFRIDLPLIKNPNIIQKIPEIYMKIIRNLNGNRIVRYEGRYRHLNHTFSLNSNYGTFSSFIDTTSAITVGSSNSNTLTDINLPIISPLFLSQNDMVVFSFPLFWPQSKTVTCSGFNIKECFTITDSHLNSHFLIVKINENIGTSRTVTVRTLSPSSILPNSLTNEITQYIYKDTRWIKKNTLRNFSSITINHDNTVYFNIDCNETPIINQETDYTISFRLNHGILPQGFIEIEYYNYRKTTVPCYNSSNSQLNGEINCTNTYTTLNKSGILKINNFHQINNNQIIEIRVRLQNNAIDATLPHQWRIKAYYKENSTKNYLITDSGKVNIPTKCVVQNASTSSNQFWFQMYHKRTRLRTNEKGPIRMRFIMKNSYDLPTGDDWSLYVPKDMVRGYGQEVITWFMRERVYSEIIKINSTIDPVYNVWTIYVPRPSGWVKDVYNEFEITTINGKNDKNGYIMPNNERNYAIHMYSKKFRAGINDIYNHVYSHFQVFKENFAEFQSESFIINANFKNAVILKAKPLTNISTGSIIKVRFPSVAFYDNGKQVMFEDNVGTGLNNNDTIKCFIRSPIRTIVDCRFERKNSQEAAPATFTFTTTFDINTNQVLEIFFDGYKNPWKGDDEKHVEMVLEYWNGSTHVNTGVDYDFTCIDNTNLNTMDNYETPRFSSNAVSSRGIEIFIKIISNDDILTFDPNNNNYSGWGNYVIIEFPSNYVIPFDMNTQIKLNCAGCGDFINVEIASNNRWLIYRPIQTLNRNVEYTFFIVNINQAIFKKDNVNFKVYIVKKRKVIRIINYTSYDNLIPLTIPPSSINVLPQDYTQILKNSYQKVKLTINIDNGLPTVVAGSIIKIEWPTGIIIEDNSCKVYKTTAFQNTLFNDIHCETDIPNRTFIISNFNDLVSGNMIEFDMYIKTPDNNTLGNLIGMALNPSLENKIYWTFEKTIQNSSDIFGFNDVQFNNFEKLNIDGLKINKNGPIEFNLILPSTYDNTSIFTIALENSINFNNLVGDKQLKCTFNNSEVKICDIVSRSPLIINLIPPIAPTFSSYDNIFVKIYPDCTSDIDMGFKFTASGKLPIIISYKGESITNNIEILGSDFTQSLIKILFSQANYYTSLYFKVTISSIIPNNGKIRIRIPLTLINEEIKINSQENNLGEVYDRCKPISSNLLGFKSEYIKCLYSKDSNYNIYEFSNLKEIPANSQIIFVLDELFNNNYNDDKRIIDIILDTLDENYNYINSKVFKDVYAIVNQSYSTQNSGFNLDRNNKNKFGENNINFLFRNVNLGGSINQNDYIVFRFPYKYNIIQSISDCGSPSGSYESWGRNVVFYPLSNSNGIQNFCFFGGVNPLDDFTDPILVYVVRNRFFTNILRYPIPSHTNESLTVNLSTNFPYSGTIIEVKFSIDTNIKINLQSYIRIRYPNQFKFIKINYINNLKYGYTIRKVNVSNREEIYIENIENIYQKSTDGVLEIFMHIYIPRNSNSFNPIVYIGDIVNYSNIKIMGGSTLNLTRSNSVRDCSMQTNIGKTTSSNTFKFITPYSSSSYTPKIYIKNINTINNCSDQAGSINCNVSNNEITFSNINNPSELNFEINNTMQEEKLINILFRIGGNNIVCKAFKYNVFDNVNYSSDNFDYIHKSITKNSNDFNAIFLEMNISQNIDLKNNFLKIEIIGIDESRMNLNDGDYIPCSLTFNSIDIYNLECIYKKSNYNYPTLIEIKSNQILNSGNLLKLNIQQFLNNRNIGFYMNFNFIYYNITNNRINCIICYSNNFVLEDHSATQTTENITLTSDTIQSTNNYTFIFSNSIANTNKIYTFLPINQGMRNNFANVASINGRDGANNVITTDYKNNKYLIESILNGNDTLKLNNVENPDGILTNQKIYNIIVNNSKIIIEKKISSINTINTLKNLFTTNNINNEYYNSNIFKAIYYFDFNIPLYLNYKCVIDIEFPNKFENILIEDIIIVNQSGITNPNNLKFEIQNNTILRISNITFITNTGTLKLKSIINFVLKTTGNFNGKIKIKQINSNGNLDTLVESSIIAFSTTQNSNFPNFYKRRKYIDYFSQIKANSYSRLSITFNSKEDINGTFILGIKKPSNYNYNIIEKLRCIFEDLSNNEKYFSENCSYDIVNSRFLINNPKSLVINKDKYYKVFILRYGEFNDGLLIPSNPIKYNFEIQIIRKNDNQLISTYPMYFEPVSEFISLICPRVLWYNINRSNLSMITLKLPSTTATNLIWEVEFPNKYIKKGNQASNGFSHHLGQTSLKSTMNFGCNSPTLTLNSCKIIFGSSYLFRKTKFEIKINSGLTANTNYLFNLYNFKNPSNLQEYPEIYIRGKIISGSNETIIFGYKVERYLYTIDQATTTMTKSVSSSKYTVRSVETLTINFGTSGINESNYDNFYIQHYDRLKANNSNISNGVSYPSLFNEILVNSYFNYANNANISINDLYFDDGLTGSLTVNNFILYQIKNRIISEEVNYNTQSYTINDKLVNNYEVDFFNTYPASYKGEDRYNNAHYRNVVTVKFSLSSTLNKGTIRFKLKSPPAPGSWSNDLTTQTSFWTYNCYEINNVLGNNYKCITVNDFEIHLTNFNPINSGVNLEFKFSLSTNSQNPTSVTTFQYQICTDIFSDITLPLTNQIFEQKCWGPNDLIDRLIGVNVLYFKNNFLLGFTNYYLFDMNAFRTYSRIQANEKGQLYFKFNSKDVVRKNVDFIEIRFPTINFENIGNPFDLYCKIDELIFQSCFFDKTNRKIVMLMPTKQDLENNKEYEIFIHPIRQNFLPGNNFDFFQFPNVGEYDITLHAINDSNTQIYQADQIKYNVIPRKFKLVYLNILRTEKNRDTYIYCKLRMSTQIKAEPEGKIEIAIQTRDYLDNQLFENNLGISSYSNGKEIPLVNINGNKNLKGIIYFGSNISGAPVVISISSNTSFNIDEEIEFYIELAKVLEFNNSINVNCVINRAKYICSERRGRLVAMDVYGYNLINNFWSLSCHDFRQVGLFKTNLVYNINNLTGINWNPNNRVGEVSSFTYTWYNINVKLYSDTNSINALDRIIMRYVEGTDLNNEGNQFIEILNSQTDKPSCSNFRVNILSQYKAIELIPLTDYNIGDNITISCTNFKNQQYVINGGSNIAFYIISNYSIVRRYITNTKNQVSPNIWVEKDVTFLSSIPVININDKYKIEILPTNKIRKLGEIHILIEEGFTNRKNCQINKGVVGAICNILLVSDRVTYLSRNYIPVTINNLLKDYNPSIDGKIEITIDMTNPSSAGVTKFRFISYYEPYSTYNNYALNSGKIDEMEIKSINILNINPIKFFNIEEIKTWQNEVCPFNNDTGIFRFKIAFGTFDLLYNNDDFIQIINHRLTSPTYDNHIYDTQRLNYFYKNDNLKYINSEKFVDSNSMIEIKVSEELNLMRNQPLEVTIDHRIIKRGMNKQGKPGKDHFYIKSKNHNNELGIIEYIVNPCQFTSQNLIVSHWHSNIDAHIEFNLRGKIQWNYDIPKKVRIQILISNWNEIKATQFLNAGRTELVNNNDIYKMGCNIMNSLWGNQLSFVPRDEEFCEIYKSSSHSLSDPLVITVNNWSNTDIWNEQNEIRTMLGDIKNYLITNQNLGGINKNDGNRNTHSHIIVTSQSLREDNVWYDTNYYYYYYQKFQHIKSTINISTMRQSGLIVKQLNFNENFIDMRVTFPYNGMAHLFYYNFYYPWNLLKRFDMNRNLLCNDSCNFMRNNHKRNSFYLFKNVNNYEVMHQAFYHSPRYSCTTEVLGFVTLNNEIIRVYFGNSVINKVKPQIMIIENDLRNSPRNTVVRYRLLVNTYDYHLSTKYIRFYIPNEFSTVGPHCIVKFGFKKFDEDQINEDMKCRITGGNNEFSRTNHLVEFYDINHYSDLWRKTNYESLHVFEFDLTNPTTSKWSEEWHIQSHDNWNHMAGTYNTTIPRIQYETTIGDNKARFWIGENILITNYFRVFRNRESFEDRKQKIGEWAELYLRIYPNVAIPANTGKIDIQLSQKYDIPDGGQKVCKVGHNNHIDLDGQFCNITNERKISVNTNKNHGLNRMCNLVTITTINSVNNNNGFRAPQDSSTSDTGVFWWNGSQLLEYENNEGAPQPIKLIEGQDLWITTECNEINCFGVLKIKFNAKEKIPISYLLNPNDPNAGNIKLGRIGINFNTLDKYTNSAQGFQWDLGYNISGTEIEIPCLAYKNIKDKSITEKLKCKIVKATEWNYYKPIEMTISNFQSIEKGTKDIEIHILDIKWVTTNNNLGWIEFFSYKQSQLIKDTIFDITRINLGVQNNFNINWVNETNNNNKPSFNPNKVGIENNNFEMKFTINDSLFQGDLLELEIPTQFIIPLANRISAIIKSIKNGVEELKSAKIIVYYTIRKIHFYLDFNIFGCTSLVPCNVSLIISGIRNAAYAFTGTYNIRLRIISRKHEKLKIVYQNLPAPTANIFNSIYLNVSSLFSNDINVKYEFNFVPSYVYTTNTKIEIILNNNLYKHINKSNPLAKCSTNFDDLINGICEIKENLVTIILQNELKENYSAKITLTGIKNPNHVGILNSNDIILSVKNNNNFKINEQNFNPITYLKPKNIDLIFLNIKLSSNFQTISSKYTFILQNTNLLPKYGYINIEVPSNIYKYQTNNLYIEEVKGLFSNDILTYSSQFLKQPNNTLLIHIKINFEWPANQQLTIVIGNIKNPSILKSDAFYVNTRYDSVLIDQSDKNDPSTYINYFIYNPKITLWSNDFYPKNEGEIGDYYFLLSSKDMITNGSFINLIFPNNFDLKISTYNIQLLCSSNKIKIGTCSSNNRILKIEILEDIKEEKLFDLLIKGIMNPNYETNGFIDISVEKNNKILQFNNKVVNFNSVKGPKTIELTKLINSNQWVLERSNYEICIRIVEAWDMNSSFLIDFPEEFSLKKNNYDCGLANGHDNLNFPFGLDSFEKLKCDIIKEHRRFNITGLLKSFSGTSSSDPLFNDNSKFNLCFKIYEVENSLIDRISHSFSVSVENLTNKEITYKTYGNLNNKSTKKFISYGYKIYINNIEDIILGIYSNKIKIELEKLVPYNIRLVPFCEGFLFEPSIIEFKFSEGKIQYFQIYSKNNQIVKPGTYYIQWTKIEDTLGTLRFSELNDSKFNVISNPIEGSLNITLNKNVFKVPVKGESLPIIIKLNKAPNTDLNIYFRTIKPQQNQFIVFTPQSITIKAGETQGSFTFKSLEGSISGLIELILDTKYVNIYNFITKYINMELIDIDLKLPYIINTWEIFKSSNYIKIRQSVSENSKIYYILTIKGAKKPKKDEMMNKEIRNKSKIKPNIKEIQGYSYVNITESSTTFEYNNVYFEFNNLNDDFEYELFTMPVDLSNNIGKINSYYFKTKLTDNKVKFSLNAINNLTNDKLIKGLSLVTGLPYERFKILKRPNFESIQNNEIEVLNSLRNSSFTFEIEINRNYTNSIYSPFEVARIIDENIEILLEELPELDKNNEIQNSLSEIFDKEQDFTYDPFLVEVTNYYAVFNVSLKYSGNSFGVVLYSEELEPNVEQITLGMNSSSINTDINLSKKKFIHIDDKIQYKVLPSVLLNFTNLLHSTNYTAYFTGDLYDEEKSIKMKTKSPKKIKFKTKEEIFYIKKDYIPLNIN